MALTNKRICITGGAGFIGSHLVAALVDQNEIVVYDNLHRNALQFAHLQDHKNLTFIKGDVLDAQSVKDANRGLRERLAGIWAAAEEDGRVRLDFCLKDDPEAPWVKDFQTVFADGGDVPMLPAYSGPDGGAELHGSPSCTSTPPARRSRCTTAPAP